MGIAITEEADQWPASSVIMGFFTIQYQVCYPRTRPLIKLITKSTRNTKKSILAIPAAPAATPPKPSTPAMMATIRNIMVHLSMIEKV
jgi:hypothetical protein